MTKRRTECLHPAAAGLDALPPAQIAARLAAGQQEALTVLNGCADALAKGGAAMAQCLRRGGRLHYAAAGSSGLMALADACELSGTFGIDAAQIAIHMAGGIPQDASMPGSTEDDAEDAARAAAAIADGDAVIVISASGSTPYALSMARAARARGATTICIANTEDAALFDHADIAICLPTPPEIIAGSTRMGAGTAQKAALNILSTVMGAALGHVHDGMMVNLRADNAKLRDRAIGMVCAIAGVDVGTAQACLDRAGGAVKPAVLLAAGAGELADAEARLGRADGHLRAALAALPDRG